MLNNRGFAAFLLIIFVALLIFCASMFYISWSNGVPLTSLFSIQMLTQKITNPKKEVKVPDEFFNAFNENAASKKNASDVFSNYIYEDLEPNINSLYYDSHNKKYKQIVDFCKETLANLEKIAKTQDEELAKTKELQKKTTLITDAKAREAAEAFIEKDLKFQQFFIDFRLEFKTTLEKAQDMYQKAADGNLGEYEEADPEVFGDFVNKVRGQYSMEELLLLRKDFDTAYENYLKEGNLQPAEADYSLTKNKVYTPSKSPELNLPLGIATNKYFYIKGNNIFSKDFKSDQLIPWTHYNGYKNYDRTEKYNQPVTHLISLQVIDENTIGFGKCYRDSTKKEVICGVYYIDLATGKETLAYLLPKNSILQNVTWFSKQKFAFVRVVGNWQLQISDNGKLKTLETQEFKSYGNEYGTTDHLSFSPNGDYLLQYSTGFPRKLGDPNIYIYNLKTGQSKTIEGRYSEWIDQSTIAFAQKKPNTESEVEVRKFNMANNTEEVVSTFPKLSSHFLPLKGSSKVLVQIDQDFPNRAMAIFDFNSNKTEIISATNLVSSGTPGVVVPKENPLSPLTDLTFGALSWVTPNLIVVGGLNHYYFYDIKSKKIVLTKRYDIVTDDLASQYMFGARKTESFPAHYLNYFD